MNKNIENGLLIGRLILGIIMLVHGMNKVIHMENTKVMFTEHLGHPVVMAYLTPLLEIIAAVALILGFFVPIAAGIIVVVMLGAIYFYRFSLGFLGAGGGGYDFNLAIMGIAIILLFTDSRKWALSHVLFKGTFSNHTKSL